MSLLVRLFISLFLISAVSAANASADKPMVESIYSFEDLKHINGVYDNKRALLRQLKKLKQKGIISDFDPNMDCVLKGRDEVVNTFTEGTLPYYGCERIKKLYKVDLTKVPAPFMKGDEKSVNILGDEPYKNDSDDSDRDNVLRIYMVQAPLEQEGRGIDWTSADTLIQSAVANLTTPVTDKNGESVPNHGIGHIFVDLRCDGRRPILTGMTTAKDTEAAKNMWGYNLGLGILFRTQAGRFNSYKELEKELKQREEKAGNTFFVDYKINKQNCDYTYYSIMELVAEGIQNKYGSLTDRTYNGTGMGCVMFGTGIQQAARMIPEGYHSEKKISDATAEGQGLQCKFYENWKRTIWVPKEYMPKMRYADEKKTQAYLREADIGIFSLLLSGKDSWAFFANFERMIDILTKLVSTEDEVIKLDDGSILSKIKVSIFGFFRKIPGLQETTLDFLKSISNGLEAYKEAKKTRTPNTSESYKEATEWADIYHIAIQEAVNDKNLIREKLLVSRESGHPWLTQRKGESSAAWKERRERDGFELTFWDPQLLSNWIQKMRGEIKRGQEAGDYSGTDLGKKCNDYIPAMRLKLVEEGNNLGFEMNMLNVYPTDQQGFEARKIFNTEGAQVGTFSGAKFDVKKVRTFMRRWDQQRELSGTEEVDPFGRWDEDAVPIDGKAIEEIKLKLLNASGSFEN